MEYFDPTLRKMQVEKPPNAHIVPALIEPSPSADQTQAIDDVFAQSEEHSPVADALWLGSAGLLLHDIVSDTLKAGKEEEKDEQQPDRRPGRDDRK
jgi:hypothetical protein